MEHCHTKNNYRPASNESLNNQAKSYCALLAKRMRKNRIDDNPQNNSKYGFNIPKVVVACTTDNAPYYVCKGRNNNSLRNPHQTLRAAYPILRGNGNPLVQSIPGVPYYPAGYCAEPHAANTLLYNMDNHHPIAIEDIRFSLAFKVKNRAVVPYCGTCRLTFPQLGR